MKKRRIHITINKTMLISLVFFIICKSSFSQKFTEYEVKAVFLVNFAKFIQWPENNDASDTLFIFGIYGKDPFQGIFDNPTFKQNKIQNKNYRIKHFNRIEDIDCDILFVKEIERFDMIQLLNYLETKPVLTIGDNLEDFCEKGGMINFTEKGYRYRFEINNDAALKSDIKISSKLLNLAKIVSVDEVKF